jgi:gluconolactonase
MFASLLVVLIAADPTPQQVELLKTFRDEFVQITPGEGKFPKSFLMGEEGKEGCMRPVHSVTIGYSFAIARYEVPQNLWEAVMGSNPSRWKGKRNSVEMVSFAAAQQFCRQATELLQKSKLIEPTQHVRLPSEAEWEYCARAGTRSIYSFGNDPKSLGEYAWYTANAAGNDPAVGAKKPNPWGLYDMHGYLWEWCADGWHKDYTGAPNDGSARPAGPDATQGVTRGGSWKSDATLLETARRIGTDQMREADDLGFRCVITTVPAAKAAAVVAVADFTPSAQDKVVPAGSKLEKLWGEGQFTEGPALAPDGSILFSDIGTTIYRYDPKAGQTSVFRDPSGRSNGLKFNQQGALIACEGANMGGNRRISITTGINGSKDGTVKTLADKFEGKRFNSPNDLAIDPRGNVYFTDPRYVGDDPRDLDFECVFLVGTDGSVKIATRDVQKPNGIIVSADGKTAYVSDNNPQGNRHLAAFVVKSDGTLAEKKVLHDFGTGRGIDGMTLDREGNIFATAGTGDKAGIYVFAADGKHLAFIPTPGDPTNCCFGGGADNSTLYITSANSADAATKYGLFRIKLNAKGYHVVKLRVPN